MKTFKQFQEEAQQLDELAPLALIPAALKLGGMALTAYSAGSALNNLRKGKFKQAGMDALGAIPGGRIFKGIRALGGAKNLAKAGSFVQSANRLNVTGLTPNAYSKGFDAVTSAPFKAFAKNKNKNSKVNNNKNVTQTKVVSDTVPKNLPGYNRKDAVKQYKPPTVGSAAKSGALGSSVPKMGSAGKRAAKSVASVSPRTKMGNAAKIGPQTLKGGKKSTS